MSKLRTAAPRPLIQEFQYFTDGIELENQEKKSTMEFSNALVSGVVIGVVTSGIWAFIAFSWNLVKNSRIETAIRKSIPPEGMAFFADGSVGITIKNETNYEVTVRSVTLIGGEFGNSSISFGLNEEHSPRGTKANERGWSIMPPRTLANWTFNFEKQRALITGFDDWEKRFKPIKKMVITVEYITLFGTTKIVDIGPAKNLRPEWFEDLLERSPFSANERERGN